MPLSISLTLMKGKFCSKSWLHMLIDAIARAVVEVVVVVLGQLVEAVQLPAVGAQQRQGRRAVVLLLVVCTAQAWHGLSGGGSHGLFCASTCRDIYA